MEQSSSTNDDATSVPQQQRRFNIRPSMVSVADVMAITPPTNKKDEFHQLKRQFEEQFKANKEKTRALGNKKKRVIIEDFKKDTMYSTQYRKDGHMIPSFVMNSPSYKKVHKMELGIEEMHKEFLRYCEYLIKVKKMIDETKDEI